MSEKTFSIQQIIDWCDKMTAEDKRPILKWEGGGDSGWVYMEDEEGNRYDDQKEAEHLVNEMYDTLDYGSWAGEFSANGEAMYNAETKCFEGTDYYSEEERESCDANIRIEIPAFIPFDRLEIETEGEENVSVNCALALDNGYVHPASHDVMTALEKQLSEEISSAIDTYEGPDEFSSAYSHYVIDRNDFKREGDMMVYNLKDVEFSVHNTVDKDIMIDLKELLENEQDLNN